MLCMRLETSSQLVEDTRKPESSRPWGHNLEIQLQSALPRMGYDDGRRRQRTETPHSLVAVIFHVSGAFNEVPHAP